MKNFKGKVAVITGAGSGIGRATAIALSKLGCDVAVSDINAVNVEETAKMAEQSGVKATNHVVNVASRKDIERFADEVMSLHKKVNIVISNAGVTAIGGVEETRIEEFERVIGINFWGVVYGTKAFLPHLKKVDEAHIVNISSILGFATDPRLPHYASSKFAVRAFTESLWQELYDTHIEVTCVHPGGIATNIAENARVIENNPSKSEQLSAESKKVLNKSPEMVANAIISAIKSKKLRLFVGWDARAIYWLSTFLPLTLMKCIAKKNRKLISS